MNNFLKTEKIYSILELNTAIRTLIKKEFPEYIWVCGEIQDLRISKDKRHIYFNLVQKHPEADEIISKVNAAIFENYRSDIFNRLKEIGASFELKDDIEVKLLCALDLYPKTGNFSLIVIDIDPIYTLGKVAQSRQRIIGDLKKEGLLDKNKLTVIPAVPLKIGLITAAGSAAYHDFTNELIMSGYGFIISVFNCHMQGKFAEKDLSQALDFFNNFPDSTLDVIVITRGGGSTADLSYFDNKRIALAIALSKFPVISAIGHQINITISDMVAHTFYKTPTKAAQTLVERVKLFLEKLEELGGRIREASIEFISEEKRKLVDITVKMGMVSSEYFRFHRDSLLERKYRIFNILDVFLAQEKEISKGNSAKLKNASCRIFKQQLERIKHFEGKVDILNPDNILKRGYSITLKDLKALKSADNLDEGDAIETILYNGKLLSQVTGKEMRSSAKKEKTGGL